MFEKGVGYEEPGNKYRRARGNPPVPNNRKTSLRPAGSCTYIVFLAHVHLAGRATHVELLLTGHLAHATVMPLVSDRRRGRQDKGAGNNDGQERQAKHEKRVLAHDGAVLGAEGVGLACGPELLALKGRHASCFGGRGQVNR
ncbi:hypothetical protein IF1G_03676 [Cordyceps javanica]|uniref:Uncharacterized protein n=1 Tax=Cordyceps javanica TaxID=43265 RepID=A0A545V887_9HYPO|nr:hypothetical protein IF1G_03676 [Cordyceps javanica]